MTVPVDLGASTAVGAGEVRAVSVGPLDLVLWRSEDGTLCVMDARCPHQWSHLAAEGTVTGDEIVCLAHFWRFDTAGRGTKVAMNGRRDRKGDIGVHPAVERAGRVIADLPAAAG